MEESQREAMFNAWHNSKIWLDLVTEVNDVKAVCYVVYKDIKYRQEFYKEDCFGSADPLRIAFSKLQSELKEIDKNIEIKFTEL